MTTIDGTKIVTKSNILSQHLLVQSQQWKQQNNWHRFGVFVNFEQISLKFLVFPLLTLNNLLLVGILFLISKKVSLVFVQNRQSNMTLISLDFYVQLANWKIWKHWNLWFFSGFETANIFMFKVNNRSKKVWIMVKVDDKNIRTTSMTSFWCHYC